TRQSPTCQILPPNFQGYEPFCPYTLEPDAGVWSAPDLDRAGALIEDADAVGEKGTVWVTTETELPGAVEIARYVRDVLNELGLRADLKIVHDHDEYIDAIYEAEPQAFLGGWSANYPGAGGFIDDDFRCGRPDNASGACTESLAVQIEGAQRLQATDPVASNNAWIEIEHQLVKDAVWAPLMNSVFAYAFSARTENVQVHPVWGILLSRL